MKRAIYALALLAAAHGTMIARGAVIYWRNHVEPSDFTIPAGDTLVLRGTNTVHGLLLVSQDATLTVDPEYDAFLHVATIDVYGTFRIGSRETPYTRQAVVELACASPFLGPDVRRKAVVVHANATLALHGAKGATGASSRSWTRLQETAQAGDTTLTLDLPSGWQIGDTIVVPSTDFDPHQAEKRTITGVTPTGVQLDRPLQFMHYGRISEGVDERAEIGLLSRSITFRGCQETGSDMAADVGGHMLFLEGFQHVQVQGIELENFGQGDQLGRYAMHFHLCGRVPSDTFLVANAIHDSNFRAIVLHGTQGVRVDYNVLYNITGHAVMLEDGAETGNTLRHNLVVLVREKLTHVRLGSDAEVALSAFYLTNPNNTITDNVVAGVEGTAFWIDTRLGVKGLSYLTGKYDTVHPFRAPLGEMARNVAHSVEVGFKIESPNFLDALDAPQQTYSPPYTYSPDTMPVLRDFLVHHSRQGGWFRSFQLTLDKWIVGDVTEGLQILSRGDTSGDAIETYVANSLFVGGTRNRGNLVTSRWQFVNYLENRSDSAVDRASDARMAIKLYDGPMYLSNCTFRLWQSQPCLNVTNPAIGTRLFNVFLMATAIVATDLTFEETDVKFAVSDRQGDGGISTSLVDKLGAISGLTGATLLPDWEYYAASNCRRSPAWGLACPQRYVNVDVVSVDANTDPTRYGQLHIYRNNVETATSPQPTLSFAGQYIPASSGWLYHPIVSPNASYTLQFERHTPDHLRLRFSYTKAGDVFTLVVAYPAGSQISSVVNQDGASLSNATSSTSSCVNCFRFDAARSFLSITIQERAGPEARNASCSPLGCLSVDIRAMLPTADTGVSTAQLNQTVLPFTAVTDTTSDWRRQPFKYEAAVFVDQTGSTDWCQVDDPCLHAIDEGNAKMGVLAYYESPCVGVGCFSSTCRYCKLTFSAANVPFPGCPFDPNYVPTVHAVGACTAFASIGNSAAGVEVIEDVSCVNGGGTNGTGCITDACRYCKTTETAQSSNFLNCSVFSTASAMTTPGSSSLVSVGIAKPSPLPTTVASSPCQQLVSLGDADAGISALADATCQFGGLGCFTAQCRFCKTRDTRQSSPFLVCSQSPASIVLPIISSITTQASTTMMPTDTCWQAVSPGDAAAGLAAISDATCARGGLGCLSSSCRFCSVQLTPQSTPYLPCNALVASTPATAQPLPVIAPLDPCAGLVSSGDVAAGITAMTQRACGTLGGLGCVTDSCQYCKTRTTLQSAHLLNCTQLLTTTTTTASTRKLQQETRPSSPMSSRECASLVSFGDAQSGIAAFADATCSGSSSECFARAPCRFCKYRDSPRSASLAVCPSLGDTLFSTPTPPSCAQLPAMLALPSDISAVDEPRCNTQGHSLRGCVAFSSCRLCTNSESARLPQCDPTASAITVKLASDDNQAATGTTSWSPIILFVVGAACTVAAATIVVHKRVRGPRGHSGHVRVATPRSLPRSSSDQRVDVVTLSHSSSDATADFFVL